MNSYEIIYRDKRIAPDYVSAANRRGAVERARSYLGFGREAFRVKRIYA